MSKPEIMPKDFLPDIEAEVVDKSINYTPVKPKVKD